MIIHSNFCHWLFTKLQICVPSAFYMYRSNSLIPKQNSCSLYHPTFPPSGMQLPETKTQASSVICPFPSYPTHQQVLQATHPNGSHINTLSPSPPPPMYQSAYDFPPGLVKSNPHSFHSSSAALLESPSPRHNCQIEFIKCKDVFITVLLKTF